MTIPSFCGGLTKAQSTPVTVPTPSSRTLNWAKDETSDIYIVIPPRILCSGATFQPDWRGFRLDQVSPCRALRALARSSEHQYLSDLQSPFFPSQ
jgi:hypothetical protein